MIKRASTLLMTLLFLISFTTAQISISEQKTVYNVGDKMYLTINGIVGADEGNLNINLICSDKIINLLKVSARTFSKTSESSYSLPYKILTAEDLEIEDINSLVGTCSIHVTLGNQLASSPQFKISNQVLIEARTDKEDYNPGEKVLIDLKVTKENGEPYVGELILSNFTEDLILVENTKTLELALENSLPSGEYTVNFNLQDSTGNQGSNSLKFKVNQVPSKISFGVNTLEINPGENLSLSGEVLDQAGELMYETIEFEITSPKGIKFTEVLPAESPIIEIYFPYNSSKGSWKIVATTADLRDELTFVVLASPHLEYSLEGTVLTVTNTGNTAFKDYFNLTIGSTEKTVYVELEPAEFKQFVLSAPAGDYEIVLNDGKTAFTGSTFLTGNAISIKDLGAGFIFGGPLFWLLIIVILGIGGYILMQKNPKTFNLNRPTTFENLKRNLKSHTPKQYSNKVSSSLNFTNKSPESQSIDEKNYKSEDSTMKDLTINKLKTAESSLVLRGEKVMGGVLSLKITNYEQLNEHSISGLEGILQSIKSLNAVIDKRDNYIFFLFIPQITKTYKNEILAIRAGEKIKESLVSFNKKFKQKIIFNLGVNTGELVISKTGDKIKYTSLGNTIAIAKKLSDSTHSELIINETMRKRLLRDLKLEKFGEINGKLIFKVLSMKDKEANEAKLKELLKRM